jgi:hypothetical protein
MQRTSSQQHSCMDVPRSSTRLKIQVAAFKWLMCHAVPQMDESALSKEPKHTQSKIAASDWSTAGDMSIATDTELTGDLPSLARALSDRVRMLVRMHAAAGSGLSPRAKKGRRPSPQYNHHHQPVDVEEVKTPGSESAGVHGHDMLGSDTILKAKRDAAFPDTSSLQSPRGFVKHNNFQQCGSVADSSDGVLTLSPRQLQPEAHHSVSNVSKRDCSAAAASRETDANAGDSGSRSSTGYHGREPSLRLPAAPFPAAPTSEQVRETHQHGSATLREGSNHSHRDRDSILTAPPDPFSLHGRKPESHRAASGRQSGIVAVRAMPGRGAANDADSSGRQSHVWQFNENLSDKQEGSGREFEGGDMRVSQEEEPVQGSQREEAFRGDEVQDLKGELESVRAMITEMQAIRAAVQHGDIDGAMVLLLLPLHATCIAVLY